MRKLSKTAAAVLTFIFIVNAMTVYNVGAQPENTMQPYQSVIDDVNKHYGTHFSVADYAKFKKYIADVMSPAEFEEMLAKDAQDFRMDAHMTLCHTDINPRTSVSNNYYSVQIKKGDKSGKLFAVFEVVDLTSLKFFNKLISAGSQEDSQTWYFHTQYRETIRIEGGTAVIKHVGFLGLRTCRNHGTHF